MIGGKVKNLKSRLINNQETRDLINHSLFAFIIRIVAAISSFVMNLVVARQLGAYEAGNFFLAFAIITVVSTFTRLGGDNLIMRHVSIYAEEGKWANVHYIIKVFIKRVLIFSSIVTILLLIGHEFVANSVFNKSDLGPALLWMLSSIPIMSIYTIFAFAFQGLKRVITSVSIQSILVPITIAIMVQLFKPIKAVEISRMYFVATVLTMLATLFFWFKKVPREAEEDQQIVKIKLPTNFWKSSYSFWVYSILQISVLWGGQFIAGAFSRQEDLAKLAVCQRTTLLITFILVAVNLVSAPKFASMYKQGKHDELKKYAINATRLMVALVTPIVIFILVFPTFIMSLFGAGFEDGILMLRILAIGQFVNVITGSVGYLLLMSGHERDLRNITFVSGAFSIILNIILINMFGVLGAAIAIALSTAAQNLFAVGMVKKRLGFNTMAIWTYK